MVRRSDGKPYYGSVDIAKALGRYALPSPTDINLIRSIYR